MVSFSSSVTWTLVRACWGRLIRPRRLRIFDRMRRYYDGALFKAKELPFKIVTRKAEHLKYVQLH